jgi:ParB-like chromosome segregation protein Spo0J
MDDLTKVPRPDYSSLTDHPHASLMPMMDDESFSRLRADIAKNGIRQPMVLYQGFVLDGRNRLKAARSLGIVLSAAHFRTFEGNDEDAREFVISENMNRRQLNNKQKREFCKEMIRRYPKTSDREFERQTGMSKNTFAAARDELENSPEKRREVAIEKFWKLLTNAELDDLVAKYDSDIRECQGRMAQSNRPAKSPEASASYSQSK